MSYPFVLTLVILSAENNALRMAAAQPTTGLPSIPRPEKGTAGNGFNLCAAMELGDDPILYGTVRVSRSSSFILFLFMNLAQRCVRSLADRAGLDYTIRWHAQNKETVGKIIGAVSPINLFFSFLFTEGCTFQARERHSFLSRYPRGWPVEEFLKTYLKNKRAYARRKGYLENTDQNPDSDDDDDEGEDKDKGIEGKSQEIEGKGQEIENTEWNRGIGWRRDDDDACPDDEDGFYV